MKSWLCCLVVAVTLSFAEPAEAGRRRLFVRSEPAPLVVETRSGDVYYVPSNRRSYYYEPGVIVSPGVSGFYSTTPYGSRSLTYPGYRSYGVWGR